MELNELILLAAASIYAESGKAYEARSYQEAYRATAVQEAKELWKEVLKQEK